MFDLVLRDLLMPVMDGMDCVKQYREWEPTLTHPFVSGLAFPLMRMGVIRDQGFEAGMDELHPKPISIKTLTEIQQSDGIRTRSR
jgi:CheY-like chemotaxis protein